MKLYITIILLAILMLAAGIFSINSLTETTKDITRNFNNIYQAIDNQEWEAAETQITKAEQLWNKHKKWWTVVIDHQEIDNIGVSFAKLGEYIKSRDKALSSGEFIVLKQFLEHIPEKETINLKNIL